MLRTWSRRSSGPWPGRSAAGTMTRRGLVPWMAVADCPKPDAQLSGRPAQPPAGAATRTSNGFSSATAPDDTATDDFEAEYRYQLFQWAVAQFHSKFHESTWKAFWETAVEGRKPKDVAAELGLTAGAVYVYRNRVMAQIKQTIEQHECD